MKTIRRTITVWNEDEKVASGSDETTVADGQLSFSGSVGHGTEPEVDLPFAYAKAKAIVLKTQGAAVTVKTNSTSAPDDHVDLPANGIWVWTLNDGACPWGVDVVKFYIDNNDGALAAQVTILIALDVTP